MPAIRGITVAVGEWYARTLEICLVRNMRHLTSCLVVTTPGDEAVKAVVARVPGASVFETDAFHRPDANGVRPSFNKSFGLELGFDVLGRHGLILIHDADVIFPDSLPLDLITPGCLHGARRRILEDPSKWHPGFHWNEAPPTRDGGPIGFFQLFAADDPAIKDRRPWYDVSFAHAGGGDAWFLTHWPVAKHKILPVELLHLGPRDTHWFGVDPAGKELMQAFIVRNGWTRSHPNADRGADARVGAIVERVEVPGYAPSGYELPFVRRAREARR